MMSVLPPPPVLQQVGRSQGGHDQAARHTSQQPLQQQRSRSQAFASAMMQQPPPSAPNGQVTPSRTVLTFSKTVIDRVGDGRTGLTPEKLQLGGTGLTPMKHGGLEMSPSSAFASTGLTPINPNVARSRSGAGKTGASKSGKKQRRNSGFGISGVTELSPTKEDWTPSTSFTPLKNMDWSTGFTPLKDPNTDWSSFSLSPFNTNLSKTGGSGGGKSSTPRSRDLPSRQFWGGLPSPAGLSGRKRHQPGQGSQAKKAIKLEGADKSNTSSWPTPTPVA